MNGTIGCPTTRAGRTAFRLAEPGAHEVFLVGDFNNWQMSTLPMRRRADGEWELDMKLEPGLYQYRYLVDGEWRVDPPTCGVDSCPFGCNILVVQDHSYAAAPAC